MTPAIARDLDQITGEIGRPPQVWDYQSSVDNVLKEKYRYP
jgi:hypothetical protein